jgi:hypothetical protein
MPESAPITPLLITRRQAAKELGVHISVLKMMIASGKITDLRPETTRTRRSEVAAIGFAAIALGAVTFAHMIYRGLLK